MATHFSAGALRRPRPRPHLWLALLLGGLLAGPGASPLSAQKGKALPAEDKTLSPYFVVLTDDPTTDALPLKSTRAEVRIAGTVAAVKVTQVYRNQGKKTLEAIYVFPGSTRAAVHALRMTVGGRVVEARIMERRQARETYEQAKREGKTASLLEQQRPNVFQMNLANILPGDEIKVELDYLELLEPQEQIYEFVFPTVVGPRYSNLKAKDAPESEKWVQNPYLREGEGPPYTFGLKVNVNSGLPLVKLASPSHEVDTKFASPTSAEVTLKDEKTGGNRDFVLRYSLAGNKIETGLLLYPGQDENFFLLMLEPPARVEAQAVVPREYIFIVDVSGSMHGFPLDITRALMEEIIKGLRPTDFMNVLLFESGNAVLSDAGSLPATDANKEQAIAFIKARPGGGGTEIMPAFKRALALPRTPNTSRIVVVATDGYVRVEPELFNLIRKNLGEANLFPFGIGASVNRHLIEGMARAGLGEPFVLLNAAEARREAARFKKYIDQPVLNHIKVSFSGFGAYEVEPEAVPDLFALRPITVMGKYRGSPGGTIVVTGKTAAGDFRQEVKVADGKAGPDNAGLRLLWARKRIARLTDQSFLEKGEGPLTKEITGLGLRYSLMTQYTSFVAVDQVKRADGTVVTVKQPLPLPQGVSGRAVGEMDGGFAPGAGKMLAPPPLASYYGGRVSSRIPAGESTEITTGKKEEKGKLSLRILETAIKGAVDQAAVETALEGALPKLETCVREAAARKVKLPPEIVLTFTIGPDGRITGQPLLKTPGSGPALGNCLQEKLKGLTFPKPAQGAATVTVKLAVQGG